LLTSGNMVAERTVQQLSTDTPTVLVTDAERGSALAIIRVLGRQGCRVIAASSNPRCAGAWSRHSCEQLTYPSPQVSPGRCAEAILSAAASQDVDLIIPVTDDVILPLNARRGQLPPRVAMAMADESCLLAAWNKQRTLELAEELEVPCPQSRFADNADMALLAAEEIGWPVVVKPISSRSVSGEQLTSFRVQYAANARSLRNIMASLDRSPGALIQELVQGEGRGIEVLAENGELRAAFQHHRLREVPVSGGVSSFRESEPLSPELLEFTRRLMKSLHWTGLAMVEFKSGPNGPRLMEINGRVWGSLPLPVACGMDFPGKLLKMYQGQLPAEIDTNYRVGIRCRNLALDMKWAAQVLWGRRQGQHSPRIPRWRATMVPLSLLSPKNRWDVWSLTDPLPGVAAALAFSVEVVRKAAKSVLGGRRDS
jgi:predicted ATP-grasp superfamily ATP-dependent carboligase